MNLFIVSTHRDHRGSYRVIASERCKKTLISYAYQLCEKYMSQCWGPDSIIIVDSGAFTGFTAGVLFSPEEYLEWSLEFQHRWGAHVRRIEFMSLDVIGNQEASWRNYWFLKTQGLECMPIVTCDVDLKEITRALDISPRIALGGLVPLTLQRERLRRWLDACFATAGAWAKANKRMPEIHLLGISTPWCLWRYPCASADSSSWAALLRYGGFDGKSFGLPDAVPKYGDHTQINEALLRIQLRAVMELEKQITARWDRQGIVFPEER